MRLLDDPAKRHERVPAVPVGVPYRLPDLCIELDGIVARDGLHDSGGLDGVGRIAQPNCPVVSNIL